MLPVYVSIASGSSLVFIVVVLNAMTKQQSRTVFFASLDDGHYLEYAATWLMAIGVFVAFLQTQFLMQRLVQDRYVEFGLFINIGIPRRIVGVLISLEQISHAATGGVIGILFGFMLLLAVSLSRDYVSPRPRDTALATAVAAIVPVIAVVPLAITLVMRLRQNRGGISRVR